MLQNVWLLACFFIACHFFGAGFNPMFLLPGLIGPLVVLAFTPAARLGRLIDGSLVFFWSAVGAMLLIAVHHIFFSVSPDTSFIPSIVLACLPLWALTVALLKNPYQFWLYLSLLIAGFALLSALDFLFYQQRAHAPLRDPGNYLTLLYLVWIPWLFHFVNRRLSLGQSVGLFLGTWLFALALLATHSRFALLLVAGVAAGLMIMPPLFGAAWRSCVIAICAIGVAAAAYYGLDQAVLMSSLNNGGAATVDSNPRLLLWQSTWQAITSLGGINGTGLYTFSFIYPMFRSPLEQTTAGLLAHNDLLQLLLEGGVWLLVPLTALVGGIALSLSRALWQRRADYTTWLLLALAVAMLHAAVNFVFYILPLVLVVGAALAYVFGVRAERASESQLLDRVQTVGIKWAMVGLLAVNVAYLCLDVLTLGVFSGHHHVPGSASIRQSESAMLSFARTAQRLNADRALPVFAEAKLLERKLQREPSPLLRSQADLAYQRALQMDPWNPEVSLSYMAFKARQDPSADGWPEQQAMLYDALALNPYHIGVNAALFQQHVGRDELEQALYIAANVAEWCMAMARTPVAPQVFDQVSQFAARAGDMETAARARACIELTSRPTGGGRKLTPFMRWLNDQNGRS